MNEMDNANYLITGMTSVFEKDCEFAICFNSGFVLNVCFFVKMILHVTSAKKPIAI